MADFSHLTKSGEGTMVDVSDKEDSIREAVVVGWLTMPGYPGRSRLDRRELQEIVTTARIAGVMAAKKTADAVPYCHPIPITKVDLQITYDQGKFQLLSTVRTKAPTGVEMEAMHACQTAALTIYDMVKAVYPDSQLGPFVLREKSGGKSGTWAKGALETDMSEMDRSTLS